MKSKLALIAAVFVIIAALQLILVRQANAAGPGGLGNPQRTTLTTTNSVIAASTNASLTGVSIPCATGKDVAVQVTFKGIGADTGDLVLKFSKTVDGVNDERTAFFSWTMAANGTNTVSYVTNITVNAVPQLDITYWANTSTNALTNIVIRAYPK